MLVVAVDNRESYLNLQISTVIGELSTKRQKIDLQFWIVKSRVNCWIYPQSLFEFPEDRAVKHVNSRPPWHLNIPWSNTYIWNDIIPVFHLVICNYTYRWDEAIRTWGPTLNCVKYPKTSCLCWLWIIRPPTRISKSWFRNLFCRANIQNPFVSLHVLWLCARNTGNVLAPYSVMAIYDGVIELLFKYTTYWQLCENGS